MRSLTCRLLRLWLILALVPACVTSRSTRFEDPTADWETLGNPRTVEGRGGLIRLTASGGDFASFSRQDVDLDGAGQLVLVASGGRTAVDPFKPGAFSGGSFYNGGTYRYGVASSPVLEVKEGFESVVPHFEVETPAGSWVTVRVSARIGGTWTRDYILAVWASDDSTIKRHSVDGQEDAHGRVETDTLVLAQPADALKLTVALFSTGSALPKVRGLGAIAKRQMPAPSQLGEDRSVWGTVLEVPERSQMLYPGGDVWCSPTATSMIVGYWARKLNQPDWVDPVPVAASRTHDWIYGGTGNWPFNTAYASSRTGGRLGAFITKLSSVAQLERLVRAGVPVVIPIRYNDELRLDGAPLEKVVGHLIVVRGFDADGNVVVNDPAFPSDATVRVTYKRDQLERSWAVYERVAYVIHPQELALPDDPLREF